MQVLAGKSFTFETSNGDGTGTILITPKTETQEEFKIYIKATNPNNNETIGEKEISACFQYDELTPVVTLRTQDGKFSKFTNNVLNLGDGESVSLNVSLQEENTIGHISSVKFVSLNTSKEYVSDSYSSSSAVYSISDKQEDVITYTNQYRIQSLYVPYYHYISVLRDDPGGDDVAWDVAVDHGPRIYPNWQNFKWKFYQNEDEPPFGIGESEWDDYRILHIQTNIGDLNFYTIEDTDKGFSMNNQYDGEYDYLPTFAEYEYNEDEEDPHLSTSSHLYYGKEIALEYYGFVMTEEDFKNCAWLYYPGTPKYEGKQDGYTIDGVTHDDFEKGKYEYGKFGSGTQINVDPGIISEHVTAAFEQIACSDEAIVSSTQIGLIEIAVTHLNASPSVLMQIPVYYDVRNCANK